MDIELGCADVQGPRRTSVQGIQIDNVKQNAHVTCIQTATVFHHRSMFNFFKRTRSARTDVKREKKPELRVSLLENYKESLSAAEKGQIFISLKEDIARHEIGGVHLERDAFIHILSFLDGKSLLRCCAVSRPFFLAADTPFLFDALDGLYDWKTKTPLIEYSMGRHDYRIRHKNMKMTPKERDIHRRLIQKAEWEEKAEFDFPKRAFDGRAAKTAETAAHAIAGAISACVIVAAAD